MEAYKKGFTDGLKEYAYWKDGVQYVGTTGKTLKEAIKQVEQSYNYNPINDPLPSSIQEALNSGDGVYRP